MPSQRAPSKHQTAIKLAEGSPAISLEKTMPIQLGLRERAFLLKNKTDLLLELARANKACYFGSVCAGSHEYTQEGFYAAQENERQKQILTAKIRQINLRLGLDADDALT